jgi:Transcriptional regulator
MSTQSVVTAIKVLETVSAHQPIGLSEVARLLDRSKATVLRMLSTLAELGWVAQDPSPAHTWSLTFHAYAVGSKGGSGMSLRDLALGPMSDLQLDTTETIHLCVPDGRHLVVVERLDTSHVLRAFLALGTQVPMNATGTGLAFLAASPDDFIKRYLSEPLERRTRQTHVEEHALRAEITTVRERGYSINEGGLNDGTTSLGAAIVDPGGRPLGSVSISGPTSRITPDKFSDFGAAVARTAAEIGAKTAR